MTYNIISTGSKGNAVLLEGGILVDCGVPFKALKPYLRDIKLVLLTHIHGDHFKRSTVRSLAEQRPTVRFACREWMVNSLLEAGVPKRNIDVILENMGLCYGDGNVTIEPVTLTHDVPNCGWRIWYPSGPNVFYATDTGTLDGIEAKGFDYYFIEENYDEDELQARLDQKIESGEFAYEARAEITHLSRSQAEEWICDNAGPASKYIPLHQHREEGKSEC